MRSRNRYIEVQVRKKDMPIPLFVEMAQRHFEKERPATGAGSGELVIPVDFARLAGGDLADSIEEIRIGYKRDV